MRDESNLRLRVEVPGERYHQDLVACQVACPVHTDARGYVRAIAAGRFDEAYLIARGPNPFASICGRICGAPCEAACRRGRVPRVDADGHFIGTDKPVSIRALKRFVCERHGAEAVPSEAILNALRQHVPNVGGDAEEMAAVLRAQMAGQFLTAAGEKVAIIGGGPAGLAAAHDLALLGLRPTVFETETVAAGMLAVGVPSYRLPREVIRREVAVIEALGVEIRLGVRVGRDVRFADLRRDHAAVLIAVGAKQARLLGIPGERGPRVYGGVDFLRAVSLGESLDLGEKIVVIGGGNVAYDVARSVVRQIASDAARTAARLPGKHEVVLVSLETLEEMPADTVEIREGDEEGIERRNGWGPLEIQRDADGRVCGVALRRCLRVYDEQRRFQPVFDDAAREVIDCDTVLIAAGQSPDLSFLQDGGEDVEQFRPGWPRVDANTLVSSAAGIFVAGDLAHGTRLLIDAVASGKKAARSIYQSITGHQLAADALTTHLPLPMYRREIGYERLQRAELETNDVNVRLADPDAVVEKVYSEGAARREAARCLDCGVTPVFDGSRCVLCGGCADVCPTSCLKLVPLSALDGGADLDAILDMNLGDDHDIDANSVILKDEDRCIRCALCAMRCPADAIVMERVQFTTTWRTL